MKESYDSILDQSLEEKDIKIHEAPREKEHMDQTLQNQNLRNLEYLNKQEELNNLNLIQTNTNKTEQDNSINNINTNLGLFKQKQELLQDYREKVLDNMPGMMPHAAAKKEHFMDLPEDFRIELANIMNWKDLHPESSGPVYNVCVKFFYAGETDKKKFDDSLNDLIKVCNMYLTQKAAQHHWWFGEGNRRIASVTHLVAKAESYLNNREGARDIDDIRDEKKRTKRMLNESKVGAEKHNSTRIRHYQALDMLKLINEQNKEANEENVEREISKKEFKNAVSTLKKLELSGLKFGKPEELFAYGAQNNSFLLNMKKLEAIVDIGMSMDMDISAEDLEAVMVSRRLLSEIRDYIDLEIRYHANYYAGRIVDNADPADPEYQEFKKLGNLLLENQINKKRNIGAVKRQLRNEIRSERASDVERIGKIYSDGREIVYAGKIENDQERYDMYKELKLYDLPEVKEKAESLKDRPDRDRQINLFIDYQIANSHEAALKFYDKLELDSEEGKKRWVSYMQRMSKFKIIKSAEASSKNKEEVFKKLLERLESENDEDKLKIAEFTQLRDILKNLILTNGKTAKEVGYGFMKRPEKNMNLIKMMEILKDHMPIIIEKSDLLGIDNMEINDLITTQYFCEDVKNGRGDIFDIKTEDHCLMDPKDALDQDYKTGLATYLSYINQSFNKEGKKKKKTMEECQGAYKTLDKYNDKDTENIYVEKKKEASTYSLKHMDKLLEEAWYKHDENKSFMKEDFETYKWRWYKTCDKVERYYSDVAKQTLSKNDVELKQERERSWQKIQEQKYRFDNKTYLDILKDMYRHDRDVVNDSLKKMDANFERKNNESYLEEDFLEDKKKVLDILNRFVARCNKQLDDMTNTEGAESDEESLQLLVQMSAQVRKMSTNVENFSYDDYLDLNSVGYVTNWFQIADKSKSEEDVNNLIHQPRQLIEDYTKLRKEDKVPKCMSLDKKYTAEDFYEADKKRAEEYKVKNPMKAVMQHFSYKIMNAIADMSDEEIEKTLKENNNDWGMLLPEKESKEELIRNIINTSGSFVTMDDVLKKREIMLPSFLMGDDRFKIGPDDIGEIVNFLAKLVEDPEFAREVNFNNEEVKEEIASLFDKLYVLTTKVDALSWSNNIEPEFNMEGLSDTKKKLLKNIRKEYSETETSIERTTMYVCHLQFVKEFKTITEKLIDSGVSFKFDKNGDGKLKDYMPDIKVIEDNAHFDEMKEVTFGGHTFTVHKDMEFAPDLLNKTKLEGHEVEMIAEVAREYNEVHSKALNLEKYLYPDMKTLVKREKKLVDERDKKSFEKGEFLYDASLRSFTATVRFNQLLRQEENILRKLKNM